MISSAKVQAKDKAETNIKPYLIQPVHAIDTVTIIISRIGKPDSKRFSVLVGIAKRWKRYLSTFLAWRIHFGHA